MRCNTEGGRIGGKEGGRERRLGEKEGWRVRQYGKDGQDGSLIVSLPHEIIT